jgi:hypothetical protein
MSDLNFGKHQRHDTGLLEINGRKLAVCATCMRLLELHGDEYKEVAPTPLPPGPVGAFFQAAGEAAAAATTSAAQDVAEGVSEAVDELTKGLKGFAQRARKKK